MSATIESKSIGINLEGGHAIPDDRRILFVGSELQARARLEGSGALGRPVDAAPIHSLPPDVANYEVAIVDLDEVGPVGIEALRGAGFTGRVLGFFSHVNEALGIAARAAGAEVWPRGRFWREVGQILSPPDGA